jgi:hypothetical protein
LRSLALPVARQNPAFVVPLVCSAREAVAEQEAQSRRAGRDRLLTDRVLGISLPIPLSALLARYGEPDFVDLPGDEPSPQGQWFFWSQPGGQYVRCLVAEYSRRRNPQAEVVLIETGLRRSAAPHAPTIASFVLGQTAREEVERAYAGELEPGATWRWAPGTLKLVGEQRATYFMFGTDGRLVGVAQCVSDIDSAG